LIKKHKKNVDNIKKIKKNGAFVEKNCDFSWKFQKKTLSLRSINNNVRKLNNHAYAK
jgi:hypothetical protein